jgi:uncharacterized protein (DUF486 family)
MSWPTLLSLDFARPCPGAGLAAVYLLSRLPLLTRGYGADPDTWRVAMSARYLWAHGEYYPSRLPGYPLFELTESALYPLGATVMNLATLLVSFVGVLLFAALVKRLRVEPKGLLTLAFAFAPVVWINSAITLDYLWGLTFILAAYLALVERRPLLGGVLLGVAIGCRPASVVAALPFGVLLARERRPRPLIAFCLALGLTAFIAFLPVSLRYGPAMFNFFDVRPSWHKVARTLGVEAFGLTTTLGCLLVLALSWRQLLALPHELRRDIHLAVSVLMLLLTGVVFLRLPLEWKYLTPVAPFALIAAARLLSRPAVVAICLLLVMGSVLDFHTLSQRGWRDPVAAVRGIRPVEGRVLVDYELRRNRLRIVDGMRALDLPAHSVVTAGFYYPIFAERYGDELSLTLPHGFRTDRIGPLADGSVVRTNSDVVYVWLLTPGEARKYRAAGYRTFTMDLDGRDVLVTFETYLPDQERFAVR